MSSFALVIDLLVSCYFELTRLESNNENEMWYFFLAWLTYICLLHYLIVFAFTQTTTVPLSLKLKNEGFFAPINILDPAIS